MKRETNYQKSSTGRGALSRKLLSVCVAFIVATTLMIPHVALAAQTTDATPETPAVLTANVAEVGDKGYTTLQAAIDEALSGETVKLLADTSTSTSFAIPTEKNITIDGGKADGTRYKITGTDSVKTGNAVENSLFVVDGSLSLKNVDIADVGIGVRTQGQNSVVAVDGCDVKAEHYALALRDINQTLAVVNSNLTGWAGIMTSAGDLGLATDTNSIINVKNVNINSVSVNANDPYGAITLQQNYNKVAVSVEGGMVTLEGKVGSTPTPRLSVIDDRSYGSVSNISDTRVNAQGITDEGLFTLTKRTDVPVGNPSTMVLKGITYDAKTETLQKINFKRASEASGEGSLRVGDTVTLEGVSYAPGADGFGVPAVASVKTGNETVLYGSLSGAIAAVLSSSTVSLLGNVAEDVSLGGKSLTIEGNGYGITGAVTGSDVGDITLKNIVFTAEDVFGSPTVSAAAVSLTMIADKTATVLGCTFTGITSGADNCRGLLVQNGNLVFKNNSVEVINGTSSGTPGIETRGVQAAECKTATISGNSFTGLTGTPITVGGNQGGPVIITGNTINGWGTAKGTDNRLVGRAMRIDIADTDAAGVKVTVAGNKMVKSDFASGQNESFVKLTGTNLAAVNVSLKNNYWGGLDPAAAKAIAAADSDSPGDDVLIAQIGSLSDNKTAADVVYPYYTNLDMTTLQAGPGAQPTSQKDEVAQELSGATTVDGAKKAAGELAVSSDATKEAIAQDPTAMANIKNAETVLLAKDSGSGVSETTVSGLAAITAVTGATLTAAAVLPASVAAGTTYAARLTVEPAQLGTVNPASLPGVDTAALGALQAVGISMDVVAKTSGGSDAVVASNLQPAAPITLTINIPAGMNPNLFAIAHYHGSSTTPDILSNANGRLSVNGSASGYTATFTLTKLSKLVMYQTRPAPPAADIPVANVTLDQKALTLDVGKTGALKATVLPANATDKTVTWATSDLKIATVDEAGKVIARSAGTATISAKAGDALATCEVTVAIPTFTDVDYTDPALWYAPCVKKAAASGLMIGSDGLFRPYDSITRGESIVVLYRATTGAGDEPAVANTTPFTDVEDNLFYTKAINWAWENKMITGDIGPDGKPLKTFRPNDTVSRQETASMCWRIAGKPGAIDGGAAFDACPDKGTVQDYAVDALRWTASVDILSGVVIDDKKYLEPGNNAQRCEGAKIFTQLVSVLAKA